MRAAGDGQTSLGRRAGAWAVDVALCGLPLLLASPFLVGIVNGARAVDGYLAQALAVYLLLIGWAVFVFVGTAQAYRDRPTLGRRRFAIHLSSPSRPRRFMRALLGPIAVLALIGAGLPYLILLWPALALIDQNARGPLEHLLGTGWVEMSEVTEEPLSDASNGARGADAPPADRG